MGVISDNDENNTFKNTLHALIDNQIPIKL